MLRQLIRIALDLCGAHTADISLLERRSTRPSTAPSLSPSQDAQGVLLAVQDSGIGIAPEQAQSIFEPFTQLSDGRDVSAGGLGLGLALVRSVTELHGGHVRVSSKGRGHGSRFTVRLPPHQASSRRSQSSGIGT